MNSYPIFTEDWGADEYYSFFCGPETRLRTMQGTAPDNRNPNLRHRKLEEDCGTRWNADEGGDCRALHQSVCAVPELATSSECMLYVDWICANTQVADGSAF